MIKSIDKIKGLFVDILPGSSINETINDAKDLSHNLNTVIIFRFNGILIEVDKNTNVDEMENYYYNELNSKSGVE